MTDIAAVQIVDCAGSPDEIGAAHGESQRHTIAEVLDRWLRELAGGSEAIDRLLTGTHFVPTIKSWAPDLWRELEGLARGANQPFETMLAYNLMDEEWSFRSGRMGEAPGCTAIAIEGVGIGQTMDIPSVHDGSQIVLRMKPNDGPAQIVFTGAGMLALNGANADGVGVVVNNLSQNPASDSGLPVMFVVRSILARRSRADAVEFVKSVPHAIGQHYLICGPDGISSLEAAANGVFDVPLSSCYVHANHPLANDAVSADAGEMERLSNSHARADRARELATGGAQQSAIEHALEDSTAPISRSPAYGFMTFGGTSIAIGSPPDVRIAPGPPHLSSWSTISWEQANA